MSQATPNNQNINTATTNKQQSKAIVVKSVVQRAKGLARSRSCSENQSTPFSQSPPLAPSTKAMVVGYGTSLNNSSNIHQLMYNHRHSHNNHNHHHPHHHHHHPHPHHRHHQHYRRTKFVTSPGVASSPPAREMDTFVSAELHHQLSNSCTLATTTVHNNNNNINGCTNNNNNNNNSIKNKTTTTTSNRQCDSVNNNNSVTINNHHRHHTSNKSAGRREPLTIEEYESKFRQSATDLVLIERIFAGSIACNQLRAALWPYLFGLILHRGHFEKVNNSTAAAGRGNIITGSSAYVFIEHEANYSRWKELREQYEVYRNQWESIQADQELRFSTFRERKSHIERDVIRCDRLHPFYAEQPQNLNKLTQLLMTYMMYDFDIGYVQGMSDIAAPILCMYQGDLVKTFWVFVEVMKLFRRNFELTQKTIHFQLDCLYKLIKNTDPVFAQYLKENDSSNCFFAFRSIVCQFKRELMKEDEDDYSNVLFLWDTIWCVDRRRAIQAEMDKLVGNGNSNGYGGNQTNGKMITNGTANGGRLMANGDVDHPRMQSSDTKQHQQTLTTHNHDSITNTTTTMIPTTPTMIDKTYSCSPTNTNQQQINHTYTAMSAVDINQANSTRYKLTETEIFVLALCLSMIRRERDIIMAHKLDATDIHLHFINPKLANDLNGFIEHAISIYLHLKNEMDLTKLTSPKQHSGSNNYHHNHYHNRLHEPQTQSDSDSIAAASPISTDGYDLLSDFLIIGGTSGSCMQIIG